MMDEIVGGLIAAVTFFMSVVLWQLLLFNLGRGSLLLCTLGRYPRGETLRRDANRIALTGLFVLILVWSAIAL